MRRGAVAITLVWPLLAGFCDGLTTDPREGGYLAGKCALGNGAYDDRLKERRSTLDRLDRAGRSLEARAEAARRESSDLATRIGRTRARIAEDRRQIGAFDAEIERRRADRAASEAELAELKAEKLRLEARFAELYEEASATELAIRRWRDRGGDTQTAGAVEERSRAVALEEKRLQESIGDMRRRMGMNRGGGAP